jgi:hypothetical protein
MIRASEALFNWIVESFSRDELEILLRYRLKLVLDRIAGYGTSRDMLVHEVIAYVERHGRLPELIAAVADARPRTAELRELVEEAFETPYRGQTAELQQILSVHVPHFDPDEFFGDGQEMQSRVCAIEMKGPRKAFTVSGTGFLIGPDLVLTAHHVLEPAIDYANDQPATAVVSPKAVRFRFDFRKERGNRRSLPGVVYGLAADGWLVAASRASECDAKVTATAALPASNELDFAVVRLNAPAGEHSVGGSSLQPSTPSRGWLSFPKWPLSYLVDSPLLILHHPRRGSLKLSIESKSIIGLNGNRTRLLHRTNTEPGSSGAPCFNASWELVSIHQGAHKTKDGAYNQAIPIGPIAASIRGSKTKGKRA